MKHTLIIVPCYNEAKRIDLAEFRKLNSEAQIDLLFVDDGSTDDTVKVLSEFNILKLSKNSGKAEAVRQGLLKATEQSSYRIAGFLDADLSTPASEAIRLHRLFDEPEYKDVNVMLAARVGTLGAHIERKMSRHYLGRVFATFASIVLNLRVYDTQCGMKYFKNTVVLKNALSQPFTSRWAFDVELIGRLMKTYKEKNFLEVPLKIWRDVAGSKLKPLSMVNAGLDLLKIYFNLRKFRKS